MDFAPQWGSTADWFEFCSFLGLHQFTALALSSLAAHIAAYIYNKVTNFDLKTKLRHMGFGYVTFRKRKEKETWSFLLFSMISMYSK